MPKAPIQRAKTLFAGINAQVRLCHIPGQSGIDKKKRESKKKTKRRKKEKRHKHSGLKNTHPQNRKEIKAKKRKKLGKGTKNEKEYTSAQWQCSPSLLRYRLHRRWLLLAINSPGNLHSTSAKLIHLRHSGSRTDTARLHQIAQTFPSGLATPLLAPSNAFINPVNPLNLETHTIMAAHPLAGFDAKHDSCVVVLQSRENQEGDM